MRVDASLYNPDLAPIPLEKRSWGTTTTLSLWVAMSVCIPTYMLACGIDRRRHELAASGGYDFPG